MPPSRRKIKNKYTVSPEKKISEWRKPEIVTKIVGGSLSGAGAIAVFLLMTPVYAKLEKLRAAIQLSLPGQADKRAVEPWGEISFRAFPPAKAAQSRTPAEEALFNSRVSRKEAAVVVVPAPPSPPKADARPLSQSAPIHILQNADIAADEQDSPGKAPVLTIFGPRKPAASHMGRLAKNAGLPDLTRAGSNARLTNGESAIAMTKENATTSFRVFNGSAILSFTDSSVNVDALEYVAKSDGSDYEVFTPSRAKLAIRANGDIDILVTHVANGDTTSDLPGMPLELLAPAYRVKR